MAPDPSHRFDRDTAVERVAEHRYAARVDPGWFIVRGPNGGYLAAMLLRALEAAVGDPARTPRSLTIHYPAAPAEGDVEIETRIERVGRSMTTASARLVQGDRPMALAIAAFSLPRDAVEVDHVGMPETPPPDALPVAPFLIPVHERYETRYLPDAGPGAGADEAVSAAWIRTRPPRRVDAPLVAAYTDALSPSLYSHAPRRGVYGGLPTVDLTIHFRSPVPRAAMAPDDHCLLVFRTRLVRDGFAEEDGEVWSRDGVLLAQSRQLAVLLPG